MEKANKSAQKVSENEAMESLETVILEVECLARAFEVISEACEEAEEESVSFDECSNRYFLN